MHLKNNLYDDSLRASSEITGVCMYVCMYVCMCVCICVGMHVVFAMYVYKATYSFQSFAISATQLILNEVKMPLYFHQSVQTASRSSYIIFCSDVYGISIVRAYQFNLF